jgi:hypothetical protein
MNEQRKHHHMEWHLKFSLISGLFMGLVFLSMGIALLAGRDFLPQAQPPWRNYAGGFLILWSAFRLFLTALRYRRFKSRF